MLAQELLKGAQLASDGPPVAVSDGPSGQVETWPVCSQTMNGSTSDIFRAEARGLDALSQVAVERQGIQCRLTWIDHAIHASWPATVAGFGKAISPSSSQSSNSL